MCQTRLTPYKVAAEGRDKFLEGFNNGKGCACHCQGPQALPTHAIKRGLGDTRHKKRAIQRLCIERATGEGCGLGCGGSVLTVWWACVVCWYASG